MKATQSPEVASLFRAAEAVYTDLPGTSAPERSVTIPYFYELVRHTRLMPTGERDGQYIKYDSEQPTNAYKLRGAFALESKILAEDPDTRGFVANTAGNFGLGVVASTQFLNMKRTGERLEAHIFMANSASQVKKNTLQEKGAHLHDSYSSLEKAGIAAKEHARANPGMPYIHPAQSPALIAGHSTAGAEIMYDLMEQYGHDLREHPTRLYVGVGYTGYALALATLTRMMKDEGHLHPLSHVVGVQQSNTDATMRTIDLRAHNKTVPNDLFSQGNGIDTFDATNDGTAVRVASIANIIRSEYFMERGDLRFMRVEASDVGRVMIQAAVRGRHIEPAGALGIAGMQIEAQYEQRAHINDAHYTVDVAIESGKNVTSTTFAHYRTQYSRYLNSERPCYVATSRAPRETPHSSEDTDMLEVHRAFGDQLEDLGLQLQSRQL